MASNSIMLYYQEPVYPQEAIDQGIEGFVY